MKKAKIILSVWLLFRLMIILINNGIAIKIQLDLLYTPLPDDTQLIDSTAIAKKIYGDGNGMQYTGAILVRSSLQKEDLKSHYIAFFSDIEVDVESYDDNLSVLRKFFFFVQDDNSSQLFIIGVTRDFEAGSIKRSFLTGFLELDLRGH